MPRPDHPAGAIGRNRLRRPPLFARRDSSIQMLLPAECHRSFAGPLRRRPGVALGPRMSRSLPRWRSAISAIRLPQRPDPRHRRAWLFHGAARRPSGQHGPDPRRQYARRLAIGRIGPDHPAAARQQQPQPPPTSTRSSFCFRPQAALSVYFISALAAWKSSPTIRRPVDRHPRAPVYRLCDLWHRS